MSVPPTVRFLYVYTNPTSSYSLQINVIVYISPRSGRYKTRLERRLVYNKN